MARALVDTLTPASNATAASQLLHLVERIEPITPKPATSLRDPPAPHLTPRRRPAA